MTISHEHAIVGLERLELRKSFDTANTPFGKCEVTDVGTLGEGVSFVQILRLT